MVDKKILLGILIIFMIVLVSWKVCSLIEICSLTSSTTWDLNILKIEIPNTDLFFWIILSLVITSIIYLGVSLK